MLEKAISDKLDVDKNFHDFMDILITKVIISKIDGDSKNVKLEIILFSNEKIEKYIDQNKRKNNCCM